MNRVGILRPIARVSGAVPMLLAAAAGLVFLAPAVGRAQATKAGSAPAGNAKNGEKLFVSYGCYSCHGRHAEGSSATGPRLGPNAVTLGLLQKYIRQPTGQMPPYTTKVCSTPISWTFSRFYNRCRNRPRWIAFRN